jgi:hypothetical protein
MGRDGTMRHQFPDFNVASGGVIHGGFMKNKMVVCAILTISILTLGMVLSLTTQNKIEAQTEDTVVVDYEASKKKVFAPERVKKNLRFNDKSSSESRELISELPEGVQRLPTIVHWWVGLSALPVVDSDAVLVGTVISRAAYLSQDETNVYTEYQVGVEDVLKDPGLSITAKSEIPLVRHGGAVRFNSGKVQKYEVLGMGILKPEKRYLLFVRKSNGVDDFILTGYELSAHKAIPIDGQDNNDPERALVFRQYLGATEEMLLRELRKELLKGETRQ